MLTFTDKSHASNLLYLKRIDYYDLSLLMSISTELQNNDSQYYEQMKSELKRKYIEEYESVFAKMRN